MLDASSRGPGRARNSNECTRARRSRREWIPAAATLAAFAGALAACGGSGDDNAALVAQGQQIFRFDTFGDEAHWTGTLRMHEVIGTVSPVTALAVGLKVDAEALPPDVIQGIRDGSVDLKSPPRRWPC